MTNNKKKRKKEEKKEEVFVFFIEKYLEIRWNFFPQSQHRLSFVKHNISPSHLQKVASQHLCVTFTNP